MKALYRNVVLAVLIVISILFIFSDLSLTQLGEPLENQVIKDGLSIAMTIDSAEQNAKAPLREGDNARVQFTIQDALTKEPVKGLHPAVWMERQNSQGKAVSCQERINSYLQSQLTFKPEINFNSYFVLSLNDHASISVIDPINGYGGSKLIARVNLNSHGVDWALSKDNKKLYVATPLTREVAVVDTQTWKAISFLKFAAVPTRLALQADGNYLWVGLEDAEQASKSGISIVDTEKLAVVTTLATGAGHHEVAFSDDSRTAFISNTDEPSLTIVDIEKLSIKQTVKTPFKPVSLAFSGLSKSLFVATQNGSLLVLDTSGQLSTPIETGAALKVLRFSPDGRWGFAVSQTANKVFVIDASLNRLAQTIEVGHEPDQIAFTDSFAYVRSTANEIVSMLSLDALSKNSPVSVTTFPGGQAAPNQSELLLTDAIVPTPERNAVVVANPTDKTVYYYMEGMAAPMGNFENQGMKPMAAMIVNRSMQETSPGVYSGATQLPPAGNYNVSILLSNPTVYHCFEANITANPELVSQSTEPLKVEYLLESSEVPVGLSVPITIKLNHARQDKISDLQVLVFRIPGQRQQRLIAKSLGDNLYQVEFTPLETGVYQMFVQSPSLNFSFDQQAKLTFRAIDSKASQ